MTQMEDEVRNQFTFYRSFFEAVFKIKSKTARAEAYDAICKYALFNDAPDVDKMSDAAAIAFMLIKPNLDASRRKAKSGKNGGSTKQMASKAEANSKQSGSKTEANDKQEQPASEKEKEKEREKESENDSYCSPPPPSASKRFVPPTLAEVQSYVAERQSPVDPQGFIDFYASKGWMVGKTPMKDWKAACRNAETWERWSRTEASAPPKKGLAQALTDRQMEKYMGW